MTQPIIIGAGLSGLTAACHLAERGLPPIVLEADPVFAGGRLAGGETVQVGEHSFRLEHGVHGFWQPYINLFALLDRYQIDPGFLAAQEETWVHRQHGYVKRALVGSAIRGSWLPAPLHYLALFLRPRFLHIIGWRGFVSLLSVWYSLILAVGIDPLREQQPMAGLSLLDFTKGWSKTVRDFGIGLARNSLSANAADIPMAGFVAFLRYYTLLRRDAWGFFYLPGDAGTCLIEPLQRKLVAMGGEVRGGTAVTHLTRTDDDGWHIHSNQPTLSTNHLILAADPDNAHKILQQSGLVTESDDFYWPRGRATAVIRLWFNRAPQPSSSSEAGIFTGDFTVDNFFWLQRLQRPYRAWHEATGGSAIEVHVYDAEEVLAQPNAVLLAKVVGEVTAVFPELRGCLIHQHLQRNSVNHTLFGIGAANKHVGVVTPWANLTCCGDWVYDPAPSFFMERAALTGIKAANRILQEEARPTFALEPYPVPEPLAALVERLMHRGRRRLLARRRGG
ncbi:MAG: FAD-dependent oxidoreductase [Ardenticatenaceae bacterium]|nr:FAD-dependent oxidoreductase [Ardenticatenaceae bacterium]